MKRCAICHSKDLRRVEEKHRVTVQLRSGPFAIVVSGVPAVKCGKCGEGFFDVADLARADLLAAAELANRGIQEGEASDSCERPLACAEQIWRTSST
jgi:YgiT-type zinc finger domain-containing protein